MAVVENDVRAKKALEISGNDFIGMRVEADTNYRAHLGALTGYLQYKIGDHPDSGFHDKLGLPTFGLRGESRRVKERENKK